MKNYLKITVVFVLLLSFTSCGWGDKTKRNKQYMPDMYQSVGYETYSENPNLPNGMTSQKPVDGTIARGNTDVAYDYENTTEGYELAKDELKSPLEVNEKNLEQGEYLYNIYCTTCHGKNGDGQGDLVKNEKFLGVPNYKDRELTEGSIYHVIMYGRNLMGSHASQLRADERWQVTQYVQKLKNELK